jgi:hypothetical protein
VLGVTLVARARTHPLPLAQCVLLLLYALLASRVAVRLELAIATGAPTLVNELESLQLVETYRRDGSC